MDCRLGVRLHSSTFRGGLRRWGHSPAAAQVSVQPAGIGLEILGLEQTSRKMGEIYSLPWTDGDLSKSHQLIRGHLGGFRSPRRSHLEREMNRTQGASKGEMEMLKRVPRSYLSLRRMEISEFFGSPSPGNSEGAKRASSRLSESDSEHEVKEVSEFTCSSPAMRARFAFSSSLDSELEDSELDLQKEVHFSQLEDKLFSLQSEL
ncbi:hypothetical protein Taro_044048 [Colocasia esculenta]|uniref:Uncharacterized protein n=1 Tax=Colocasia esculenta TaxID=4460 RepID=A0A843WI26_COLES|nr:hypothetical protein [Colocasia esculenta]